MDKKQKQRVYMVLCSCGHFAASLGNCGFICESSVQRAEYVMEFTHPHLKDWSVVEMEVKNG